MQSDKLTHHSCQNMYTI